MASFTFTPGFDRQLGQLPRHRRVSNLDCLTSDLRYPAR